MQLKKYELWLSQTNSRNSYDFSEHQHSGKAGLLMSSLVACLLPKSESCEKDSCSDETIKNETKHIQVYTQT